MMTVQNPFHEGEIEAQRMAGANEVASWASGFIRDHMPPQHREFYTSLPFLVVTGSDTGGLIWTTILEGKKGFVSSPTDRTLQLDTAIDPYDPLYDSIRAGTNVGAIGIELASRRRNRFSGAIKPNIDGYAIEINQSFGNCPQYITEREWHQSPSQGDVRSIKGSALTAQQQESIKQADTLFLGSGQNVQGQGYADGYDASHRGGAPGFVSIKSATQLLIPDYAGNNFFNSIGNLIKNPSISLLFIDFENGGLLQISGKATIDWDAKQLDDPNARRVICVDINSVIERKQALSLRWRAKETPPRKLKVVKKVEESNEITSFFLQDINDNPLSDFQPGQYLPIELKIPGHQNTLKRTYTLSGPPNKNWYRLSVKRETKGLVSSFLHDGIDTGDIFQAKIPAGNFVIPCSQCPLVLVSAGVGVTPMLSILHSEFQKDEGRKIWFVHGARNSLTHAFKEEVATLVNHDKNVQKHVFYSKPMADDRIGKDYDHLGRLSVDFLIGLDAGPDAHYMLCGPSAFLSEIQLGLELIGVATDQIHFESFGPTGA